MKIYILRVMTRHGRKLFEIAYDEGTVTVTLDRGFRPIPLTIEKIRSAKILLETEGFEATIAFLTKQWELVSVRQP